MKYDIRWGICDASNTPSWEGSIIGIDENDIGPAMIRAIQSAKQDAAGDIEANGGTKTQAYYRPFVTITAQV